jgi:hypothetical protein
MTVFGTSALTRQLFTDADFTATKWDNAAEKAAFANPLCRFASAGFREALFTQKLYRRMALSFGHIAHFERGCFYEHFFRDLQGEVAFLEETLAWLPCGEATHSAMSNAQYSRGYARAICSTHIAHCAQRKSREQSGRSLRSFARNMKARLRFPKPARRSCTQAPRRKPAELHSKADRQACSETGTTVPQ